MMSTFDLYLGDCLDFLRTLPAGSVDSVITDPPYGLAFMGKDWDHGVPGVEFWVQVLRVAKPGAMLLAFGGTRTFHRLTCAIEDAGWEIRDCLMWLYGSGFPKSHDISKAIDKASGAEREVLGYRADSDGREHWKEKGGAKARANAILGTDPRPLAATKTLTAPATSAARKWEGWGTALKPAWEPIILAMKPLDGTFAQNAQRWGVAGLHVDGARIGTEAGAGRWPANLVLDEDAAALLDQQSGKRSSGNLRAEVQRGNFGTHGIYGVGLSAVPGRDYEANTGGASRFFYVAKAARREREAGLDGLPERERQATAFDGDSLQWRMENGEPTNPKAPPASSRNHHPTVKPLRLMEYLCTLTATPTGGVVLDPFMGSGTTGVACMQTGRNFIGCEIDAGYFAIAKRRIEDAAAQLPLIPHEVQTPHEQMSMEVDDETPRPR